MGWDWTGMNCYGMDGMGQKKMSHGQACVYDKSRQSMACGPDPARQGILRGLLQPFIIIRPSTFVFQV